jgi:hypothetical protein
VGASVPPARCSARRPQGEDVMDRLRGTQALRLRHPTAGADSAGGGHPDVEGRHQARFGGWGAGAAALSCSGLSDRIN